jgi:hypothetical protein
MADTSKAKEYLATRKRLVELRKDFEKEGKALFKEGAAGLFERFPKLGSFAWTQYAPYFNDGEPCEFCAHTGDPYVNGINYVSSSAKDADPLSKDNACDEYDDEAPVPEMTVGEWRAMEKEVKALLAPYDDDDLRALFGDDAKVVVTAKKVSVEHYDHD